MSERQQIVEAARRWLGTPFHHQARARGIGVDCIGLVIGVCRDTGRGEYDFHAYDEHPSAKTLLGEVSRNLDRGHALQEGSILLFNIVREPQHFGIYTGSVKNTMVHAYAVHGKVVEEPFDAVWRRRLLGVYEYRSHYG